MKVGHKTSEFWLIVGVVILASILSLLLNSGLPAIGAFVSSGFYAISRSMVKNEKAKETEIKKVDVESIDKNAVKHITVINK